MVLTQRIEVDVAAQDYLLIVLFGEESTINGLFGILDIAAGQIFECLHNTGWSSRQPLPLGILADVTKDAADCRFGGFSVSSVWWSRVTVGMRLDGGSIRARVRSQVRVLHHS